MESSWLFGYFDRKLVKWSSSNTEGKRERQNSLLPSVLLEFDPGNFTNYRLKFKIDHDMLRATNLDLRGTLNAKKVQVGF